DRAPGRILWVTRGAVAARPGDAVPGLAQSVLWGLARGVRAEHPGLGLTLLDLDAPAGGAGTAAAAGAGTDAAGPDHAAAAVPALLLAAARDAGEEEPELAMRDGSLLVP